MGLARTLRHRIETSDWLARFLGRILAGYLQFCFRTGRWQIEGEQELRSALQGGPVLYLFWHGRLMMAPVMWPDEFPIAAPRDPSPAGKLSAATQIYLGTHAFEVRARGSSLSALRTILELNRKGYSLGLSGDGPRGPDRRVKRAVIDWARATGLPVFGFAWSARRVIRLRTWDKLVLPLPFTKGRVVFRKWEGAIPKRLEPGQYSEFRKDLGELLDASAAAADGARNPAQ